MYAAGYHYHHDVRTMDPRSRLPDDPYAHPPPNWQMLPHPPYPDLGVPIPPAHAAPGPGPAHVPSPLSTPSNAGGNSPVDYFAMHPVGASHQEQWMMQQAQQHPCKC